jgi:cobalt-zinc-cadmium efflux system protein
MSEHDHDHSHGHHHHHHHHITSSFKWAFFLNFTFALIELVGGLWVNSVAILSDAVHDMGDAVAIGMAYFLEKKSHSKSDQNYSYGYRRLSTASAFVTSVILLVGSCLIIFESIPRLLNPVTPEVHGMIALAILGLLVNGMAYYKMSKTKSLSQRALSLHFIEDALGWLIVLVGAIVMMFYPLPILDAAMGLALSGWVIFNVFKNLKATFRIFLQATPHSDELRKIEAALLLLPELCGVHHMHYWSLDGEKHIFTAHLALKNNKSLSDTNQLKEKVKVLLKEQFDIFEATLELEWEKDNCSDPQHN